MSVADLRKTPETEILNQGGGGEGTGSEGLHRCASKKTRRISMYHSLGDSGNLSGMLSSSSQGFGRAVEFAGERFAVTPLDKFWNLRWLHPAAQATGREEVYSDACVRERKTHRIDAKLIENPWQRHATCY